MADVESTGDGRGLSRRQMIKASAVAGAAAWTAPVIIDSLSSPAAAGSVPCPPPASLAISGAAVVYRLNGTVYWTAFASGGTTCLASPTVPNDSDFATPVAACGNYVQVSGGTVLFGATSGSVATPQVNGTCYFSATSNGVTLTQAGITAGVVPLVYLFHNGNVGSCTPYGSKGHWAILCSTASPNPDCGDIQSCQ